MAELGDDHAVTRANLTQRADSVQVSTRVDPSVLARVDRVAEQHGWIRSQALRYVIRQGLATLEAEQ